MRIAFSPAPPADPGVLVYGVYPGGALPPATAAADAALGEAIARLAGSARLGSKAGSTADAVLAGGTGPSPVILVNLGPAAELTPSVWRRIGGSVARHAAARGHDRATLVLDAEASALAEAAVGARIGAYAFHRLRKRREEDPADLADLTIVTSDPAAAEAWRKAGPIADGVAFARDLVNEPANHLTPVAFVERVAGELRGSDVVVEALGPDRLRELGLGAMLAVARGSENEPRLLTLRWTGADPTKPPIAFVGKGLTFDTGGISIKKADGMEEMKGDMAGGAAVVGAIRALAGRKASLNAVGVVGLVENMPSGRSYRPGDVVRSFSGRTIEVVDTDAEGRMVLADVLAWTAATLKPRAMVDLATLTGSIVAGLGHVYAGMFANDEGLAGALLAAAKAEDEALWRMPLDERYAANLDSPIADIRQCAPDNARGDAPHAAQFLATFAGATPWAHLDIAGVEWFDKEGPLGPKGASGFGVRTLVRLAETTAS